MAASSTNPRQWQAVVLALAAALLLCACGDMSEDHPKEVGVVPRQAEISYAQEDGQSWDDGHGPLPAMASHFEGEELPEGVTVDDINRFGGFGPAPDPFAEVFVGGRLVMTTNANPDSLLPYWDNDPVKLNLLPDTRVTIRLWDQDDRVQDPIGEVVLRGEQLTGGEWEITVDSVGQARNLRIILQPALEDIQ